MTDAVFIKNACQTVGKIIVVGGYVLVAEGKDGKSAVYDLLGGLMTVGNLGTEIGHYEEGEFSFFGGDGNVEGEGEFLAVYGAFHQNSAANCLTRAEFRDGFFLFYGEAKIFGLGRELSVFLLLQHRKHFLAIAQGRELQLFKDFLDHGTYLSFM